MCTILINNLNKILPLLDFSNPEEDFYFLQIIKRRKENPELLKPEKIIKEYFLYKNDLEKYFENIIELSNQNNARVYINLNKRNIKNICLHLNNKISEILLNKSYKSAQNIFSKVVGENYTGKPIWIIDVDTKDLNLLEKYKLEIDIIEELETINGFHLLTNRFDRMKFRERCKSLNLPEVDIHINSPTLLYFNKIIK